jgi:two-component system phosphate regulon sensor histidine kinase PhoR
VEKMSLKLKFRTKIVLSHVVLFLVFALVALPFINKGVSRIALNNLLENSRIVTSSLQTASGQKEMIVKLESSKEYFFFRVSLFNAQGKMLYDSILGELGNEEQIVSWGLSRHEIAEIFQAQVLFTTSKSLLLHERLSYCSLKFELHGKPYILRTAMPFTQVLQLTQEFKSWFYAFCGVSLLFFCALAWLFFYRLNYPIRQIIRSIPPHPTGQEELIGPITLSPSIDAEDSFYKLAQTLNGLADRLREQIHKITSERNERQAILESLGEGVVAVDADLRVLYLNFVGSKMLGIPRQKAVGKTLDEIGSSDLVKKSASLLQACQERRITLTDSSLVEDGRKVYLELIAAPKATGAGAILVLQDKSSDYRVLEMGKDFVANASHELRTPITIIKGFAETLQDLPELPREMVVDITEKIVRNCERMDTLVKSLLTLADLENLPNSRFHECDLAVLVEGCREVVRAVYPSAEILIEKSEEPAVIAADSDILELAIINLLDNAAKYSPPPAKIKVHIDRGVDEVILVISDEGIGIAPTDQEHIFERFYTVDKARSRRLGGAGLGLSIVRTIIERHSGTISVSSTVGKGTTFTIRLPIQH